MKRFFKELVLIIIIGLPYIYLSTIWKELPDQVPTHFNLEGNPNGWSSKNFVLFLPGVLGISMYFLMRFIPSFDPKNQIQYMGNKYYTLRLMITFFISILLIYIIYISKIGSLKNPNMIVALIGSLFALFGNYLQTIRPNYFIGIRTPWTLENERVWKKTHVLGGRMWMLGGVLIVILSFIISNHLALAITCGVLLFIMVIVPITFSYTEFRKQKSELHHD